MQLKWSITWYGHVSDQAGAVPMQKGQGRGDTVKLKPEAYLPSTAIYDESFHPLSCDGVPLRPLSFHRKTASNRLYPTLLVSRPPSLL